MEMRPLKCLGALRFVDLIQCWFNTLPVDVRSIAMYVDWRRRCLIRRTMLSAVALISFVFMSQRCKIARTYLTKHTSVWCCYSGCYVYAYINTLTVDGNVSDS